MTNSSRALDIKPVPIEEEMKRSYLDYAMSVIVSRALPDVRDGLKPVHRRILFAMKEAGNDYNRAHRKSARVVGDVMGKYHPHGDAPIYEAMVRLTQDFNLRLPLIDGQGNFGSMDGDSPAASRYTEARLSRPAHDILVDIDQDTVDFQTNYDDSLLEPKVLPARFPNLLVNGGSGIAVGMATSIPTHNLGEVIEACWALIENPDIELADLMRIIPGPDFPTGGIVIGRKGLWDAYKTGRGIISVRGKTHMEKIRGGDREAIIITEIPYQVNKARMIEKIAELVKEKTIEGISDLRDESDRSGLRVVIELKRDATFDVVLNQIYRHTPLQSSISFNMLALVKGRPEQLSLKQILENFLEFREEVIGRRTRFELNQARDKAHTLVGFALAIGQLDRVIAMIRSAKDRPEALVSLTNHVFDSGSILPFLALVEPNVVSSSTYKLSERQAQAILDLRLHRLTNMERDKIQNDLGEVVEKIRDYLDILGSRDRILAILKSEIREIQGRYASPRRTLIEDGDTSVDMEDLIEREDMVITVSVEGYIKRVPLFTYRAQRRGGRGRSGMTTREEDAVNDIIIANTHNDVLFFSTLGRVYRMKVYRLPQGTPQSKGRAMVNLLPLEDREKISTVLVLSDDISEEHNLMFATSLGNVRRNSLDDFRNIQSNGKRAMKLEEGESLISVSLCHPDDEALLSTRKGICNRFRVNNVRVFSGRDSNGVRGIRLAQGDEVISMAILKPWKVSVEERESYLRMASKVRQQGEETYFTETPLPEGEDIPVIALSHERFGELSAQEEFILTITENGYGKRSSAYEYRTTQRGSQGFTNIIVNPRNGGVVGSFHVEASDQIMLVTTQGRLIRCPVHDIRITGRRALGVILLRVNDDEQVVAVRRIPSDDVGDDGLELGGDEV